MRMFEEIGQSLLTEQAGLGADSRILNTASCCRAIYARQPIKNRQAAWLRAMFQQTIVTNLV